MCKNKHLTIIYIYTMMAAITITLAAAAEEVQGVMVTVDTDDPDIFSFKTFTVPENIPALKPKPKP